jgi:hypothetical protein
MTTEIKMLQQIEGAALAHARQGRGQLTPALYVEGATAEMTPERASAEALEANPEVYEAFRLQVAADQQIVEWAEAPEALARRFDLCEGLLRLVLRSFRYSGYSFDLGTAVVRVWLRFTRLGPVESRSCLKVGTRVVSLSGSHTQIFSRRG